jgi:hypothetical protein
MSSWMNNKVLGRLLIIVGSIAVISTLVPIYLYESSQMWPAVTGVVRSTKVLGLLLRFRRAISYTYNVDDKEFKGTQIIPRDPWVDELKEGSEIPLRYNGEDKKLTIINHQQIWQHILLVLVNALWILAGFILLQRKN